MDEISAHEPIIEVTSARDLRRKTVVNWFMVGSVDHNGEKFLEKTTLFLAYLGSIGRSNVSRSNTSSGADKRAAEYGIVQSLSLELVEMRR